MNWKEICEALKECLDVDGDGKITIKDIEAMAKVIFSIILLFKGGK